jgi:copper chaperone CopZ
VDTITLRIEGMSCGHCLRAVSEALRKAPGVLQIETVEKGRARVTNYGSVTTPAKVAAAVDEAGYRAELV